MKFSRKILKRGFVLLLVLTLLMSFSAANLLAAPGFLNSGGPTNPGGQVDVLVGFHGQPSREVIVRAGGEIYAEFTIVNVIGARMAPGAADALVRNPRVAYVELDSPKYALQMTAASTQQEVPWGIDRVFGFEKYFFTTWGLAAGNGVGVAVLDTGIDGYHDDLPKFSGGTNTVDDTPYNSDGSSHGTHVAGTIAALDNEHGVVGVAPQIDLFAVKVLSDSGDGTDTTVIKGIEWAVDQKGIKVINMSLGGDYSQSLHDACKAAYEQGHLLIASAGNSGLASGRGDNVIYPAGYESVIAVAASDSGDKRARFSSTGPAVELIAPGVSILSTVPGNNYGSKSGTSMAAPHVAGVAALVWSANSTLTNHQLRTVLQKNAEDLGLATTHQGYGLVRADLAVAAVLGETVEPVKYTVALEVDPPDGGVVSGGGEYWEGSEVTVTAAANQGYSFTEWTEGGDTVSATESYNFTIAGDRQLVANFSADGTDSPPQEPVALYVDVVTDQPEYTWNSWVYITVTVTDESNKVVPGAEVSVTVSYPDESTAGTYSGTTDSNGNFAPRYRVANRSPVGGYRIEALAVLNDVQVNGSAHFTVK